MTVYSIVEVKFDHVEGVAETLHSIFQWQLDEFLSSSVETQFEDGAFYSGAGSAHGDSSQNSPTTE